FIHSLLPSFIFFFSHCSADHRDLHSFPTRRSSDLEADHPALPDGGDRDPVPGPDGRAAHVRRKGEALRLPAPVWGDLGEVLVSGGRLLLLTDFDGTLAPLAADPTQVELAPSAREDLRALARPPRAVVGVLSGRSLGDVRAR